jgi:hypothetical protein
MQTPSSDALTDKLAVTVITAAYRTALGAGTNGTERDLTTASRPQSCAVVLSPINCPAGKTLDVKVQGRRLTADAWTDLATFTQVTSANVTTVQRASVPSFPRYRTVETVGGTAFNGTTDSVAYDCVLIGTDVMVAPITQV